MKKIKNYLNNLYLHLIFNVMKKKKIYSEDRYILNEMLLRPKINEVSSVLSVGVAHYTYAWPKIFKQANVFETIDNDVTKKIFASSSSMHFVGNFFTKNFDRQYDLLILFGVADYCSLSRLDFKHQFNKKISEIRPLYIIINFNRTDEVVNWIDGYRVIDKYTSNSNIFLLIRNI